MANNVLVTNDDGIQSPGLWALARAALHSADKVYVVAPSVNQSAVGAGITLRRKLEWNRVENPPVEGIEAWHVNGTPGDCVMIALRQIVKHWISVVVSGVNQGANMGNDILASGTVGGALQGHFRGLTSVAFSQVMGERQPDWSVAERVAGIFCRAIAQDNVPEGVFLNVNIPERAYEDLAGILVTRMGRHGYVKLSEVAGNAAILERAIDLHTNPDIPPGTDIWAVAHGYVSASPLQANLTDHRLMDLLGDRLNAAFRE
jgi:5'-nucleotidase